MSEKIDILGLVIDMPETKSRTNMIRRTFTDIAADWVQQIGKTFYVRFASLDDLYYEIDALADDIRRACVDEAIRVLVANGIYEVSERQFHEKYMEPYDSWAEDLESLTEQYEALAESSAKLDAHRTARRQSRRQWVGYGSKQSVYNADAENLISNIGHGVFNLMAKGVTAVGNSVKKSEIFQSPSTVRQVSSAAESLVFTAFLGTVDAINDSFPGMIHDYSSEEVEKARAILEHIEKGRIAEEAITTAVIRSINLYPYYREAYLLLLQKNGGDQGRLDGAVEYFGLASLAPEKKALMDVKLHEQDKRSVDELKISLPDLENYAAHLCYAGFQDDWRRILQRAEGIEQKAVTISAVPTEDREIAIRLSPDRATQGLKSNKDHKFYVTPDLPQEKLSNFFAKSQIDKSAQEIVFYFDDTVFGSGDAGVVVDVDHITVRLSFGETQCIPLTDVESIDISGVLSKKISVTRRDGSNVAFTLTQSNKGAKSLCDAIWGLVQMRNTLT